MARTCNMCENFIPDLMGSVSGFCKAKPGSEPLSYAKVRFEDDAGGCPHFVQLTEAITDGMEGVWHPHRRLYGEVKER